MGLFSVYPVDAVVLTLEDPPWEGEGTLMRCTVNACVDSCVIHWKKDVSNIKERVYLFVRSKGVTVIARAENDLVNRTVGRLVGDVHQLYINKTALTDEATYTCEAGYANSSKHLTVYGE